MNIEDAIKQNTETGESINAAENLNEVQSHRMSVNFGWIKTETGEGEVEDYMQDPLNFDKKKSTARILRGASGFLGRLNLAIIDIAIGLLEKVKERRQGENESN